MGKAKKKDFQKTRTDPTGGRPVKPPADPETARLRDQKILPALAQLRDASPKSKTTAASIIETLCQDTRCRKLLLREQVVPLVMQQILNDSDWEIVLAGWDIIYALVVNEEDDFCVQLYRKDILTPLDAILMKIGSTIQSPDASFSKQPRAFISLTWRLLARTIRILYLLAAAVEEIAEGLEKRPSVPQVFLDAFEGTIPDDARFSLLLSAYNLSRLSNYLPRHIPDTSLGYKIDATAKNGDAGNPCTIVALAVQLVCEASDLDDEDMLKKMEEYVRLYGKGQVGFATPPQEEKGKGSVKRAERVQDGGEKDEALNIALEMIGDIAGNVETAGSEGRVEKDEMRDDDDEDDDARVIDELQDMMDVVDGDHADESNGVEVTEREVNGDDDEEFTGFSDDEHNGEANGDHAMDLDVDDSKSHRKTNSNGHVSSMEELANGDSAMEFDPADESEVIARLLNHTISAILSLPYQQFQEGPSRQYLYTQANESLEEIAWIVSSYLEKLPSSSPLQGKWTTNIRDIWNRMVQPVLRPEAKNVAFIIKASTISLAASLGRSTEGVLPTIDPTIHQALITFYPQTLPNTSTKNAKTLSEEERIRLELPTRIISLLASLAMPPCSVDVNRTIGQFLISVLEALPTTRPEETIAALDAIFEVYADKEYLYDEPVFVQGGFLARIEGCVEKVKKMARGVDKRKDEDLRSRADEAVVEIKRFVEYKRKESV